jgi:hypothetical protein
MGNKSAKDIKALIEADRVFKAKLDSIGVKVDEFIASTEETKKANLNELYDAFKKKNEGLPDVPPEPEPIPEPVPTPTGDKDRFGIPYFHATKAGGFVYEMSDDPQNDQAMDHVDKEFTVANGVIRMKPAGPTSFGVGKNIRTFQDSIGGCKMNFKETAARGYASKPDDVRDLEFKCIMRITGIGDHGFSISGPTGHHDSSSDVCCQGFNYMFNIDSQSNPVVFRFRKEEWHVKYTTSPDGDFTHPQIKFKLDGHGFFGIGYCRYNKKNEPSPDNMQGLDSVILEGWFNPEPDRDINNWILIKRIEDKPKGGWGEAGDKCGGDKDQVGTWSNAQNRLKTNATSGVIDFRAISFREIDPTLDK